MKAVFGIAGQCCLLGLEQIKVLGTPQNLLRKYLDPCLESRRATNRFHSTTTLASSLHLQSLCMSGKLSLAVFVRGAPKVFVYAGC